MGCIYLADIIEYPITENRGLTPQEAAWVCCVRRIDEYQHYCNRTGYLRNRDTAG